MPLRILHILDHSLPLHSGYVFRTLSILREQRRLGWETFHLTSPKQRGAEDWDEMVDGWRFYRTLLGPDTGPSLAGLSDVRLMNATTKPIAAIAAEVRPDLIHTHSPVLNALPAFVRIPAHDGQDSGAMADTVRWDG